MLSDIVETVEVAPGSRGVEYRIDDLARVAGTTVRNVRAYQDRGLLHPPRRSGRVGLYDAAHLARLRLISELLARGYTLSNIAELVANWEQGRNLSHVLGLEAALNAPWSEDHDQLIRYKDAEATFGPETLARLLAWAEERGFVAVEGEMIRAKHPKMVEGATLLIGAGVPVDSVLELGDQLANGANLIAAQYVTLVIDHLLPSPTSSPGDDHLDALVELIDQLRPLANQVVDEQLARALATKVQSRFADLFEGSGAARLG